MPYYHLKGTDQVFFAEEGSAQDDKLGKRKDMTKTSKPVVVEDKSDK